MASAVSAARLADLLERSSAPSAVPEATKPESLAPFDYEGMYSELLRSKTPAASSASVPPADEDVSRVLAELSASVGRAGSSLPSGGKREKRGGGRSGGRRGSRSASGESSEPPARSTSLRVRHSSSKRPSVLAKMRSKPIPDPFRAVPAAISSSSALLQRSRARKPIRLAPEEERHAPRKERQPQRKRQQRRQQQRQLARRKAPRTSKRLRQPHHYPTPSPSPPSSPPPEADRPAAAAPPPPAPAAVPQPYAVPYPVYYPVPMAAPAAAAPPAAPEVVKDDTPRVLATHFTSDPPHHLPPDVLDSSVHYIELPRPPKPPRPAPKEATLRVLEPSLFVGDGRPIDMMASEQAAASAAAAAAGDSGPSEEALLGWVASQTLAQMLVDEGAPPRGREGQMAAAAEPLRRSARKGATVFHGAAGVMQWFVDEGEATDDALVEAVGKQLLEEEAARAAEEMEKKRLGIDDDAEDSADGKPPQPSVPSKTLTDERMMTLVSHLILQSLMESVKEEKEEEEEVAEEEAVEEKEEEVEAVVEDAAPPPPPPPQPPQPAAAVDSEAAVAMLKLIADERARALSDRELAVARREMELARQREELQLRARENELLRRERELRLREDSLRMAREAADLRTYAAKRDERLEEAVRDAILAAAGSSARSDVVLMEREVQTEDMPATKMEEVEVQTEPPPPLLAKEVQTEAVSVAASAALSEGALLDETEEAEGSVDDSYGDELYLSADSDGFSVLSSVLSSREMSEGELEVSIGEFSEGEMLMPSWHPCYKMPHPIDEEAELFDDREFGQLQPKAVPLRRDAPDWEPGEMKTLMEISLEPGEVMYAGARGGAEAGEIAELGEPGEMRVLPGPHAGMRHLRLPSEREADERSAAAGMSVEDVSDGELPPLVPLSSKEAHAVVGAEASSYYAEDGDIEPGEMELLIPAARRRL